MGNPFCKVGAITYHETVRFYRNSGLVEVVGWRYPVPAHEMYIRVNKGNQEVWSTLSRRKNEGFDCLVGYCTRDSYQLSNR